MTLRFAIQLVAVCLTLKTCELGNENYRIIVQNMGNLGTYMSRTCPLSSYTPVLSINPIQFISLKSSFIQTKVN